MNDTTNAPRSKNQALRWLVEHSPVTVASYTEHADVFGWQRAKAWKVVQQWKRKGWVETDTAPDTGRMTVSVVPNVVPLHLDDDAPDDEGDDGSPSERGGTSPLPTPADHRSQPPAPDGSGAREPAVDTVYATYVPRPGEPAAPGFDAVDAFRGASTPERILLLIAAGLSGTAAYMSVTGMVVMYPAEPTVIMVFGSLIELAKFVGFGVLAAGWRGYSPLSRWTAALLLLVAAVINASGVYGKLIENHVGVAAGRTAAYTTRDAGEGARLEVASGRLADIDRRINLIDATAEGAAKKGKAKTATSAIDANKRQRAALTAEREAAAKEVANLKAGRSGLAAQHQADEAATTPVRYAAALFEDFGLIERGTDPEKLMRWLSLMILLSGDPLALSLMVTINSRTRRRTAA
jgi:hypothetical protein